MQISLSNKNSPNFGMKCPDKLKKIMRNPVASSGYSSMFFNGDKLAASIDEIGSKNTTLEDFRITRNFDRNFYDRTLTVWDECLFTLKMLNPLGKQEKVGGRIYSELGGDPAVNLHENFVGAVKNAEERFLAITLRKNAEKGQLDTSKSVLTELYPEHIDFIADKSSQLAALNNAKKTLKKTSFSIKDFFIKLFKK